MEKILKHTISILLIAIIISSFMVIYNIAFAEETAETKVKGTNIVRSFEKTRKGLFKKPEDVKEYLSEKAWTRLKSDPFVFCVKHHKKLRNTAKNWDITKLDLSLNISDNTESNIYAYSVVFSDNENGLKVVDENDDQEDDNTEIDYSQTKYSQDIAQRAIWIQTGIVKETEWPNWNEAKKLWRAGKAIDMYEGEVFNKKHGYNPKVTIINNVGTQIIGDDENNYQYKIGPFKMSDYAYLYSNDVENFSGGESNDGLVGRNNRWKSNFCK